MTLLEWEAEGARNREDVQLKDVRQHGYLEHEFCDVELISI